MQDERRPPSSFRAQPLPQPHVLPAVEQDRLALRQITAHGKIRARQKHGGLIINNGVVHGEKIRQKIEIAQKP